MASAYAVERKKARRRHDAALAVAIALAAVIWASGTNDGRPEELATGYSAFFYALPVINTVIMPVGMAALASRLWDLESRGGMDRLLLTVQSRLSLFTGKALRGLFLLALVARSQGAGAVASGALRGYTQAMDASQLLWLLLCTMAVNAMLFFFSLLLGVRFGSPAPALAAGLVESLSGLFAAFFPRWLSYLMPWGYYVPLSAMAMGWDRATRETWFIPVGMNVPLLAFTLLLGAAFAALACHAIDRGEGIS